MHYIADVALLLAIRSLAPLEPRFVYDRKRCAVICESFAVCDRHLVVPRDEHERLVTLCELLNESTVL